MVDTLPAAKEWYHFANMDYNAAEHLAQTMQPIPTEIVCYHSQQAAEKILKAYLVRQDMEPPRTHDLTELSKLCLQYDSSFIKIAAQCNDLAGYGVAPKYPPKSGLAEDDLYQALANAKAITIFVLERAPELASS